MSEGVVVALRVTPRTSRDVIEGVDASGAVRVRVTAAPVDGAANTSVLKLVARTLGVPRSAVSLVAGTSSRQKRVRIEGVTRTAVLERWPGATVSGR